MNSSVVSSHTRAVFVAIWTFFICRIDCATQDSTAHDAEAICHSKTAGGMPFLESGSRHNYPLQSPLAAGKHLLLLQLPWFACACSRPRRGVKLLFLPPGSCALNPIEHLWAVFKRRWAVFLTELGRPVHPGEFQGLLDSELLKLMDRKWLKLAQGCTKAMEEVMGGRSV